MSTRLFAGAMFAMLLFFFGYSQNKTTTPEPAGDSAVSSEINDLSENYDDLFFKAVYSIDELKPYSIIQVEKTCKIYNNRWISPDTLLRMLQEDDKTFLLSRIIEFVQNQPEKAYRKKLISQIKYWCMSWQQFDSLKDIFGFNDDFILSAMQKVASTRRLIMVYYDQQSFSEGKMIPAEREMAFYTTLNFISTLTFDDQLKYYSEIYNQLSVMAAK